LILGRLAVDISSNLLTAHTEARLDNPTVAHLKPADGQFNTVDVANLELDGALVTLSGCDTGRSLVAAGDELIGLSRTLPFRWRNDPGPGPLASRS